MNTSNSCEDRMMGNANSEPHLREMLSSRKNSTLLISRTALPRNDTPLLFFIVFLNFINKKFLWTFILSYYINIYIISSILPVNSLTYLLTGPSQSLDPWPTESTHVSPTLPASPCSSRPDLEALAGGGSKVPVWSQHLKVSVRVSNGGKGLA